jgi:hypothetical protein|tara:strand:+ start:27 stop:200 length:174 start_codon:yes stop_codon:yes gene_type:complete
MRRNSKIDIRKQKQLARQKYAERQIDKWVKWRMQAKGYILYKDLVEMQNNFNIKCYD